MTFKKGQKCTNCGEPDEFSDETLCGKCIAKWKDVLILKERNRILKIIIDNKDIANQLGDSHALGILLGIEKEIEDAVHAEEEQ